MARRRIFPNCEVTEIKLFMPTDKVEALRTIANHNGLAITEYLRSLCFIHLARIAKTDAETKT